MLKKKKFELQIFFFWLTFCLPGNVVTGYLYNTSSLPAESNNQTEETCQTTDYPDKKQVSLNTPALRGFCQIAKCHMGFFFIIYK